MWYRLTSRYIVVQMMTLERLALITGSSYSLSWSSVLFTNISHCSSNTPLYIGVQNNWIQKQIRVHEFIKKHKEQVDNTWILCVWLLLESEHTSFAHHHQRQQQTRIRLSSSTTIITTAVAATTNYILYITHLWTSIYISRIKSMFETLTLHSNIIFMYRTVL